MTTVGVDLGGTKILVGAVHDGKVRDVQKAATPTGGPAAVVAAIAEMVAVVGGAEHVGVGAPSAVRHDDGVVMPATNLAGWDQPVPLAALLADAIGNDVKVKVDNDVNVAVLGEYRHGAAKSVEDVLGVWVGTGVGGGLVLGGKLRRGPNGLAGEIGHTTVHDHGRRCGCGQLGHLEAYAGRGCMETEARHRNATGEPTALVTIAGEDRMKSSTFSKALEQGDAVAIDLLDQAIVALGIGISAAVTMLDVEMVVIGGGVADKLGAGFVGRIEQAVRSRVWGTSSIRVVPAALGDDSGIVGAASMFD